MSLALGQHASAIAGQDLSQGLFGVANNISDCVDWVRFNKKDAALLASRIKDIVSVLVTEQDTIRDAPPGEWSTAIDRFKM
ncbi:hypothetical protein EXIGLDRAFT_780326 [Exidia glandulosa HHB12029]|uniref:Uncharacterized protein n=1 Tax=Exidia glandulosa HHB12029 TaxID=1314781 RepID=A0A165BNB1_EXIGL|nr:hypothetical protein EXIGLDRAFT_780326 [Exidia glandulosa HHB12029]